MATDQKQIANDIYKLVHGAVSRSLPAGVFATQQTLKPDLLRASGILAGATIAGRATIEQVNDFRGLCAVAQAAGTLAESDLQRLDRLLDNVEVA